MYGVCRPFLGENALKKCPVEGALRNVPLAVPLGVPRTPRELLREHPRRAYVSKYLISIGRKLDLVYVARVRQRWTQRLDPPLSVNWHGRRLVQSVAS